MIGTGDYGARGWEVLSPASAGVMPDQALIAEMEAHPEAAGKSSVGTRNILHAFVLSMRPKHVLEIGAHIGIASITIGAALRANGFGTLTCLEPQDHYFGLLTDFVRRAGLEKSVKPMQRLSTDSALSNLLGEPMDMIYLDANHTYSHVRCDLEVCDAILAQNGLLFLDDVGAEHSASICTEGRGGVRQALIDFCAQRDEYKLIFLEHPFWLNPCGLAIVCKQPKV